MSYCLNASTNTKGSQSKVISKTTQQEYISSETQENELVINNNETAIKKRSLSESTYLNNSNLTNAK